ncbi:MAG: hypothetical protein R3E99_11570 [Burkholderiaceae bacterium]
MRPESIAPWLAMLASSLLTACTTLAPAAPPGIPAPPTGAPAAEVASAVAECPAPAEPAALAKNGTDNPMCIEPIDGLDQALAYAERVRPMTPAELQAELKALGDPGHQPARQMQVALVLMQTQQAVDTARALGLLQRLQASATTEAETLRPLARLLAGMLSSQRRLEEQLERHAAQLRDAQRRIDRLSDRLEAMRAIERSLGPRGKANPGTRPVAP